MKKIFLAFISLYLAFNSLMVNAHTVRRSQLRELEYDPAIEAYKFTQSENSDEATVYVRINKKDLDALRTQAFISTDILDRLSDLEKLYRNLKMIIEGVVLTVTVVKKILNITDTPQPSQNVDENKVELSSGMVLAPGFVSYKAKTYDSSKAFSGLNLKTLDFDIYYNKSLFSLEHIEGDGVKGNEFKFISLPQSTSGAKDRIQVPISDLLAKEVNFDLYFVPRNIELAKVNDNTKIEVKNYKRTVKDINGNYVNQVLFELGLSSPDFIKVTKIK